MTIWYRKMVEKCGSRLEHLHAERLPQGVTEGFRWLRTPESAASGGGRGKNYAGGYSVWIGSRLGLMRGTVLSWPRASPSCIMDNTITADSCRCEREPVVRTRGSTCLRDVGLTEFRCK